MKIIYSPPHSFCGGHCSNYLFSYSHPTDLICGGHCKYFVRTDLPHIWYFCSALILFHVILHSLIADNDLDSQLNDPELNDLFSEGADSLSFRGHQDSVNNSPPLENWPPVVEPMGAVNDPLRGFLVNDYNSRPQPPPQPPRSRSPSFQGSSRPPGPPSDLQAPGSRHSSTHRDQLDNFRAPTQVGPPPTKKPRLDPTHRPVPSTASSNNNIPYEDNIVPEARGQLTNLMNQFGAILKDNSVSNEMIRLVETCISSQNKLISSMEAMCTNSSQKPSSSTQEEDSEPDQNDKDLWFKFSGEFSDNSVDSLEYSVRTSLKNPCADPSTWWIPAKMGGAKKVTPVRGSSLYLEHLTGNEGPPQSTVRKSHDRSVFTRVKWWLSKNNGHTGELKVIFKSYFILPQIRDKT